MRTATIRIRRDIFYPTSELHPGAVFVAQIQKTIDPYLGSVDGEAIVDVGTHDVSVPKGSYDIIEEET